MITKLRIKGFKGFDQLELPRLSRVTLLGGRNNVGKTSILEAVFMFFDRLNPQMILRQYAWRGVGVLPLEAETMWAPIFHNYDMSTSVVICATIGNGEEKMTITFNPNYVVPTVQATASKKGGKSLQIRTDQPSVPSYALDIRYDRKNKKSQTSHLLMGPEGVGLQVDYMEIENRQAVFLGSRMHVIPSEDAGRFGKLDIIGKQSEVLEFLKIIEPQLKGLSSVTIGDTSLIHGDIGLDRKIPIAYTGEGMSRLLSIILAIATTKGGLVVIDECENGIHYSVMSKVWESIGKAAREFDCQIIGTTHSYECLQAAFQGFSSEDMKQDFSFIRIDKEGGQTVAKTFDYDMLRTAIKANLEVR